MITRFALIFCLIASPVAAAVCELACDSSEQKVSQAGEHGHDHDHGAQHESPEQHHPTDGSCCCPTVELSSLELEGPKTAPKRTLLASALLPPRAILPLAVTASRPSASARGRPHPPPLQRNLPLLN